MSSKLLKIILAGLIVGLLVLTGCTAKKPAAENTDKGSEQAALNTRTLRLAHVVNDKDGFHIAATKFKELVEQKTNGSIKIEIFPNATLGDERTLLEGMKMGTVDMGVITNGPVANFLPRIAVFELPFLFGSPEAAYKVLDGVVGQKLLKELEGANLKGLAYAERGFRNLTNSKRPVNVPNDITGLKIRVMENPVYIDTFKTLGANAVPMAWTEALTALQQGTIDGQENPVGVIYSYKLNETQKYLSMTRHSYAPAIIVMSPDVFKSLPKETQDIFVAAAKEAGVYERKVNADNEGNQLKELGDKGMQILKPDTTPFKEAVQPVYQKYSDKFGTLIDEIQAELKK